MSDLIAPNVAVPATGGDMAGFLARPSGRPRTAVLLLVELWGMTPHMREVAERVAAAGHLALVCDLFRGATPPVPSDPQPRWAATFENFDDVRCTRDCRMAVNWLRAGGAGHAVERVFPWGFCMGGRFAHNLGAVSDNVAGVVNFYGRINFPRMANKPFLPVELTGLIDKPYLGVFAETDPLLPPADIEALRNGLAGNPDAEVHVYPGTVHAFFNDHRETYHEPSAHRAWRQVMDFIDRHA